MNFRTRLTVMVCCWALLAAGMPPASARVKEPYNCPGIHHPCDSIKLYRPTIVAHVVVGNESFQNMDATKAQLVTAASNLRNWAIAAKSEGSLADAQNAFLNNLQIFYSRTPDGTQAYNGLGPYGNAVTLAKFTALIQRVSIDERRAAANYIQTYGLYAYVMTLSSTIFDWASHHPGHATNGEARVIFDGMSVVGAVMLSIPGLEAWGLIFFGVGSVGIMYMDYHGY